MISKSELINLLTETSDMLFYSNIYRHRVKDDKKVREFLQEQRELIQLHAEIEYNYCTSKRRKHTFEQRLQIRKYLSQTRFMVIEYRMQLCDDNDIRDFLNKRHYRYINYSQPEI